MPLRYTQLSPELQERITDDRKNHVENPYSFRDENAVRRNMEHDKPNLWRPVFVRDSEKIMHLPFYNRYSDKTQVFSFFSNDDITRRSLHVQLVSRIARNIGAVLGLNLDLIEAIALGHDIGHTPFGHAGEKYLSGLLYGETGRYFNHNVHSVRVLDTIFKRNLTLQTLDGILCHNGEMELQEYRPVPHLDFDEFDAETESCYTGGEPAIKRLVPSTLEACVVRISDMIAYLGKDRQDALTAHIIDRNTKFTSDEIGTQNAAIINNLTVDILENSYGLDCLKMSEKAFSDLRVAKEENYRLIYNSPNTNTMYDNTIKPMFAELYKKLRDDVINGDESSYVFKHHISFVTDNTRYYGGESYLSQSPDEIVADYIASMTDDYFVELHKVMFPDSPYRIEYKSYFDKENKAL